MVQPGGLKEKDSLSPDSLHKEEESTGCRSQREGESMV